MTTLSLEAIAVALGGQVSGNEVLAPTPGHSTRDRGTALRIAPGAPDNLLVTCYNGGRADALAVKDRLREVGLLHQRSGTSRTLTKGEKLAIRQAEARRNSERFAQWQKAAITARQKLTQAVPADPAHLYLVAKGIAPERLWQDGKWLLVPMQDENGELQNLQMIDPYGFKMFSKGARTTGLFWWAGKATDQLIIGEGMATVAAVRRATGLPVVAALSANNLPVVAKAIHLKRPDLTLIIVADDDAAGFKAARAAAAVTGANITLPRVSE